MKQFTWHTLRQNTLIYKEVSRNCCVCITNIKFGGVNAINMNILRDILIGHSSLYHPVTLK